MAKVNEEALNLLAQAGRSGNAPRSDMLEIIASALQFGFSLIGVLCLVYTLYAGYQYVTSTGEEERVTKARNSLKNGLIGLVLVFSAYALSVFVTTTLRGLVTGSYQAGTALYDAANDGEAAVDPFGNLDPSSSEEIQGDYIDLGEDSGGTTL